MECLFFLCVLFQPRLDVATCETCERTALRHARPPKMRLQDLVCKMTGTCTLSLVSSNAQLIQENNATSFRHLICLISEVYHKYPSMPVPTSVWDKSNGGALLVSTSYFAHP